MTDVWHISVVHFTFRIPILDAVCGIHTHNGMTVIA